LQLYGADFVLSLQDTQKQILEYAKEACQAFGPNFKDQCLNYVELYGPLVVNMIVQYLKPQLCIDAGYCPQPTSLQGLMRSI
jgi:saposin